MNRRPPERARPSRRATPRPYREYRRLIAANALDFDDLIMTTVHLFQAFPDSASSIAAASGMSLMSTGHRPCSSTS